jgi:hypothetical protein
MLDTRGAGLAYRGGRKDGKYDKAEYIWGENENEKDLANDEGQQKREELLQAALEEKHKDASDKPFIRKVQSDRVEFECDGRFLASPYDWRGDSVSLGAEHEVELMFNSKRPK